jgi:hypothetical protein
MAVEIDLTRSDVALVSRSLKDRYGRSDIARATG